MTIQTPLRTVRRLGSAKDGTTHFWHQRLTAVANIPLVLAGLGIVIALTGRPYAEVKAVLGSPAVGFVVLAMTLSVLYHMRLGMQVIIEDYVHGERTRLALLIANTLFAVA